jgi:hypothetical protein
MMAYQSGSGSREANSQSEKSGSGISKARSSAALGVPPEPWQLAQAVA